MRSSRRAALALLIASLLAAPAQADWRKDYDRGLKAVESGNWAEAESAFRAALADDGAPNARKRFQGVVVKAYVPHYYAGLAAWRQGNCQRALDYWNNAASRGVVAGFSDLAATQARGISECNTRLAGTTPPSSTTTTAATTKPPVTPASGTSTTPATSTTSTTRPPAATTSTSTAATTKPPTPPAATTTTTAATKPPPAPTPSATPAPAALVGAIDAWLGGRYDAVVKLDPAALADGRAKAQGFLLRAAARHTLAELGDEAQREAARRDVRAARAANANLAPDEALFSPRFRSFFRATR